MQDNVEHIDIGGESDEQIMKDTHFYAYLKSEGVTKVEIRFKQPQLETESYEMTKIEEGIYYNMVRIPEDWLECKYSYVKTTMQQTLQETIAVKTEIEASKKGRLLKLNSIFDFPEEKIF